jgi:diaminohydroxyphosphoribosylaminopyrimidine deaminase/5-amino-6-(5-phosphoribosylamino)uracil reductase
MESSPKRFRPRRAEIVEAGGGEEQDRKCLSACFDLALLGEGETSPNPMVGALLVKEGRILGQGYHRRAGDPHAEVEALASAGAGARGGTLYVNLEPCVHHGRTPPCADALIRAGVSEVVACMTDPDPRVNGGGFRKLREAGVRVRTGILEREARRFNERFIKFVTRGVPFVILKAAMTLDGRIAAASGESRWITSPESRQEAQRLRYQSDAILVGINTAVADDPLLTARHQSGKALVRVVLDSRLRLPPSARLLANADGGKTIVYALAGAPAAARQRLERLPGVEVVEVDGAPGALSWSAILKELARRQVGSVLVEGGGRVLGSALAGRAGDRIALFIAPRILGEGGTPLADGLRVGKLEEALPIHEWSWRAVGPDLLIEGYLKPPEEIVG